MQLADLVQDARRQLEICNSCRYCEGYCGVFPALERRTDFAEGDVKFLANMCHDCRACYYACPFADPHEFAVNLPVILGQVRAATYREQLPTTRLVTIARAGLRRDALLTFIGLLIVLAVVLKVSGSASLLVAHVGPGAFYEVVPWALMAGPGLLLGLYVVVVLSIGAWRFMRDTESTPSHLFDLSALATAGWEALTLRWLKGGEEGCRYPQNRVSRSRYYLHFLVFGGFALAFLATAIAAFYQEVLGILPPYALLSAPVITGSIGGIAMIVGCSGMLWLKWHTDRRLTSDELVELDVSFLVTLGLSSLTGLLLLAFRGSPLLGSLLVLHLACLGTLYITAPYTKFAHFVYRYAALVRNRLENAREIAAQASEGSP
jgi:citrate/tricarballylate utilization protein